METDPLLSTREGRDSGSEKVVLAHIGAHSMKCRLVAECQARAPLCSHQNPRVPIGRLTTNTEVSGMRDVAVR